MQIFSKKVLLSLALTCTTSATLADNFPQTNATQPPTTYCNLGYCTFTNLQDYSQGGKPAYYFCVPNPGSTSVHMENHAVLITGFNQDGIYDGPASDLNKFYFGVFVDPHRPKDAHFVSAVDNNGSALQCYGLPDLEGRVINPKIPQLQKHQ